MGSQACIAAGKTCLDFRTGFRRAAPSAMSVQYMFRGEKDLRGDVYTARSNKTWGEIGNRWNKAHCRDCPENRIIRGSGSLRSYQRLYGGHISTVAQDAPMAGCLLYSNRRENKHTHNPHPLLVILSSRFATVGFPTVGFHQHTTNVIMISRAFHAVVDHAKYSLAHFHDLFSSDKKHDTIKLPLKDFWFHGALRLVGQNTQTPQVNQS